MEVTGGRRNLTVQMIESAVLSGAYSSLARELPQAARGLEKMRAKHSARAATLAGIVCEEARHAASSSGKLSRANSPK